MEKLGPDGPKWGQDDFVPTNPDLADILGDTDFDFENVYVWDFLDPTIPEFQVPDFQISRNLAWAQLGPGLGLGLGPAWDSELLPRDLFLWPLKTLNIVQKGSGRFSYEF